MKTRLTIFASFCLFFCCPARAQQESHSHARQDSPPSIGELGKVDFPTSCAPAVQKSFERGVALLHSFWYEEAQSQFEDVLRHDSSCAMAHWGVAMTLYHPLWDRPGAEVLVQGRAAVDTAASLGEKTPRERDYIAALAVFYKGFDNTDHEARATAYSNAMEQLHLHYPQDREAAVFYALSLLGSEPKRDPGFTTRLKAAAILEKIFAEAPDHPGVAHYLIHSYDRPQLAARGLAAARAYAKVAPAAPHALHMPSHIFNRVGLWQDTIASNLASEAATRRSAMGHMGDASHQLHAMDYLSYAYLQTGREDDAQKILAEVKGMSGMDPGHVDYMLAVLPARYALEMRHWNEAAALVAPAGSGPNTSAITYRARVIGNARSGNVAQAREDLQQFESLQQAAHKNVAGYPAADRDVDWREAKAWVEYAGGNLDQALKDMRATADLEEKDGPAQLTIPAREMLADMLLEKNRTAEALAEYEGALSVAPGRFGGLFGAARAAELAGKPREATTYYAQLLKNCDGGAHSERPELKQARALVAKK